MHPFQYMDSASPEAALQAAAANDRAMFLAGGTTVIDLMKLDVLTPDQLIDVARLPFSEIEEDSAGITIGANVKNSDLAHHRAIREQYPVLAEALLAGASAQLRNMATTAGNIMQRTRCSYFRDINSKCNKRQPGSGCDALDGANRGHAVLGTSERCIATHASDMCVALVILDAEVRTRRRDGSRRTIAFESFHLLPGETPDRETVLEQGELITHVFLPTSAVAKRSHYLKVRDRASYEVALTSAAVALEMDGDKIATARVGLGGVATKPWQSHEAEAKLNGKEANSKTFRAAAEAALANAKPRAENAFKVELAKRTLVLAFEELLSGTRD